MTFKASKTLPWLQMCYFGQINKNLIVKLPAGIAKRED